MTYVVTDNCVDCKYTDCVEVCPVDCFYELPNQLVIDPEECIDCGACVPECPVEAIYPDDEVPDEMEDSTLFNEEEAERLIKIEGQPPITEKQDELPTAEEKAKELGFESA